MCQDTGCFWRLGQEVLHKAYESGQKLCQDWTITLMAQYLAVQSSRSNLDIHWLKQSSVRHLTHNNPGPTQRLTESLHELVDPGLFSPAAKSAVFLSRIAGSGNLASDFHLSRWISCHALHSAASTVAMSLGYRSWD